MRKSNGSCVSAFSWFGNDRAGTSRRLPPSPDRQLGDTAGVVAVQQEKLDLAYLHKWAEQLRVRAELDALLTGRIKPKHT